MTQPNSHQNNDVYNRRECLQIIGTGILSQSLGCSFLDKSPEQDPAQYDYSNDTAGPTLTEDSGTIDSGVIHSDCLESTIQILLSDYPELSMVGGSAYVAFPEKLVQALIVCVGAREWFGVWKICTHGNCDVQWTEELALVVCPCHNSLFDWDGTVLQGPATRNLTAFTVCLDESESRLLITVSQ